MFREFTSDIPLPLDIAEEVKRNHVRTKKSNTNTITAPASAKQRLFMFERTQ